MCGRFHASGAIPPYLFPFNLVEMPARHSNFGPTVIARHAGKGKSKKENAHGVTAGRASLLCAQLLKLLIVNNATIPELPAIQVGVSALADVGGCDILWLRGASGERKKCKATDNILHGNLVKQEIYTLFALSAAVATELGTGSRSERLAVPHQTFLPYHITLPTTSISVRSVSTGGYRELSAITITLVRRAPRPIRLI